MKGFEKSIRESGLLALSTEIDWRCTSNSPFILKNTLITRTSSSNGMVFVDLALCIIGSLLQSTEVL